MKRVNSVCNQAKLREQAAAEKFKKYYDYSRSVQEPDYRPGQLVYLRRSDVRPHKFLTHFQDVVYKVSKVLNSEKYGQLVQLTDVKTNHQLESLIHTNRLRKAYDYYTDNGEIKKCNIHPDFVEVTSGKSPSVLFTPVVDELNKQSQRSSCTSVSEKEREKTEPAVQSSRPDEKSQGDVASAAAEAKPVTPYSRVFHSKQRPLRRPLRK